jgi:hypothetical protein
MPRGFHVWFGLLKCGHCGADLRFRRACMGLGPAGPVYVYWACHGCPGLGGLTAQLNETVIVKAVQGELARLFPAGTMPAGLADVAPDGHWPELWFYVVRQKLESVTVSFRPNAGRHSPRYALGGCAARGKVSA